MVLLYYSTAESHISTICNRIIILYVKPIYSYIYITIMISKLNIFNLLEGKTPTLVSSLMMEYSLSAI